VKIRSIDPGDVDAVHDLWLRAFGRSDSDPGRTLLAVHEGRMLGVYEGPRLVACAMYYAFDQWWHGRPVPMAGVAGVCVAPEDRGRGIGGRLAAGLLDLMEDRPLSALFPATTPVYRSVGYERAGAQFQVTLPPEPLRALAAGPVKVRRAEPGDAAEVTALLRRLHADARHGGPIDRGEDYFRGLLENEGVFAYLADDGFLAYGWDGNDRLRVRRCVAGSAETARTLWAVVGSGSSVAETVSAYVAPDDPLLWLLRDRSDHDVRRVGWMLRVLDAPAAIAARGFPAAVSLDLPLVIDDERRPGNAGAWRLTVEAGQGRLRRGPEEREATRLAARGLAALYAGIPMATLRGAGIVTVGDTAADPLLDAAFAATPFMLDYF
jgi:predicted acetyltransferase